MATVSITLHITIEEDIDELDDDVDEEQWLNDYAEYLQSSVVGFLEERSHVDYVDYDDIKVNN